MFLATFGCAVPERAAEEPDRTSQAFSDARRDLDEAQRLLARGNYQLSLMVLERVLAGPGGRAHGDEVLLTMGLIFAHPGNQNRDYQKSAAFLRRLVKEYPLSPLRDQARTWAEVLEENIKLRRASSEALQENQKLKQIIEQSKKVDIEIEEKKREEKR